MASLGPAILATPVTGLPVLLVGLGPAMAPPLVVASSAVAQIAAMATGQTPPAGASPLALTVRRRWAPPACDATMPTVLVVEAAEVERLRPGAAGRGVKRLSGRAAAVRITRPTSTRVAPPVPAPALMAPPAGAVLERKPLPAAASASPFTTPKRLAAASPEVA